MGRGLTPPDWLGGWTYWSKLFGASEPLKLGGLFSALKCAISFWFVSLSVLLKNCCLQSQCQTPDAFGPRCCDMQQKAKMPRKWQTSLHCFCQLLNPPPTLTPSSDLQFNIKQTCWRPSSVYTSYREPTYISHTYTCEVPSLNMN